MNTIQTLLALANKGSGPMVMERKLYDRAINIILKQSRWIGEGGTLRVDKEGRVLFRGRPLDVKE